MRKRIYLLAAKSPTKGQGFDFFNIGPLLKNCLLLAMFFVLPSAEVMAHCSGMEGRQCVFAVFPYTTPREVSSMHNVYVNDLSMLLDVDVELRSSESLEKYKQQLLNGAFDIALTEPGVYATNSRQMPYEVIAGLKHPIQYSLIVMQQSPLHALQQLSGRTVGTGFDESGTAIVARNMLQQQNLLQSVQLKMFNSSRSCIYQLVAGKVDACGIADPILQLLQLSLPVKFRKLDTSIQMPSTLVLANKKTLSEQKIAQLRDYFLSLDRYSEPDCHQYNQYARIYRELPR